MTKLAQQTLDDLYELLNNLEDDLQLDLEYGELGAKNYEDAYEAVSKYTLVVLREKIEKWKKKLVS